jgi:hypothetical protein
MDAFYPTDTSPATPEFVLTVLRDVHRQMCACGDADPNVHLSFDTTVAELRDAWDYDLSTWREMGRGLNAWLEIDCTDQEWRTVLKRARKSRLIDLCTLIAAHTERHTIRPARILGRACEEAGAFLTIRSMLAQAGANPDEITPSTPLAEFSRKYYNAFLGPIARLSPGAFPPIRFHRPAYECSFWAFLLSMVLLVIGLATGWPYATIAGVALIVASYIVGYFTVQSLPKAVEIGSLHTFRDLAKLLAADGPCRHVGQFNNSA